MKYKSIHRRSAWLTSSTAIVWLATLANLYPGVIQAGPRGSEFDTTETPAAGGMEGVGVVRPQDPVAMLFGNPSTLAQLQGSYAFTFGGSYVSPDLKATNSISNPNPFVAPGAFGKSHLTAAAIPHAAFLQRITPNLVLGGGLTGVSGLGSDFRDQPGFPPLIADLKLFGANMSAAYRITPRFSLGAGMTVGIAALQAGLVQNSASVNGFGISGTLGTTYDFGPIMIGATYKSEMNVHYARVIETSPGVTSGLTFQQPREATFGIATTPRLFSQLFPDSDWLKGTLIEVDYRFKNWNSAKGYQDVWKNQSVVSLGVQQILPYFDRRLTMRAGYSYGSNLLKNANRLGNTFDGLRTVNVPGAGAVPVNPAFLSAAQATITDGYWRDSVSIGMGYQLSRVVRIDTNASYAYNGKVTTGGLRADGSIFSAGMGLTWNFE
ncbi:MAG: outer membrane protein transport protein [Gammaproteobacteria bacterium]|nr:outer membrane protein transport protein [Gammaproteobacteria bacterium]